jgi:hypothetical protein
MTLGAALSGINYLAVLVAGFAHTAIGLIWFSPQLFGGQWSALTRQSLKPDRKLIPLGFLGHQVIAFTLAVVVWLANATTALEGVEVGILMWLGFVVTLELGEMIWEKIPFRLFLLRIGCHLVALSASGAILAVWR